MRAREGKTAGLMACALLLVISAALLAACGGSSTGDRTTAATGGSVGAVVHRRHATHHASTAVDRLQAALRREFRVAGPASGGVVYDLTAGSRLFDERGTVRRPPASVEKLFTSVAVLETMGPHARLHTRILATGHVGSGGVLHGNLYLQGGGDPTFGDDGFNRIWNRGTGASAAQLARSVREAGIRAVTGQLIGDASLFDAGRGGPASKLAADVPDFGGQLSALTYDHGATSALLSPGAFAAKQMATTLAGAGVRVSPAPGVARAPHGAHPIAEVSSPPVAELLRLMNVPSDDLYAEMLTKGLGARYDGHGTIAAGAEVIAAEVRGFGLHPRIVDGSGLSRSDSASPQQVVDLLRGTWHTPDGHTLAASLPLVGVDGTVRRIGVRTPAQGHCVGKTGTLDYVTNLAGWCQARNGHTLAFAVFLDGPGNEPAIGMLGRMVGSIAGLR